MKKTLGLSMLIVGSIVGAGFASGREIASYFGAEASLLLAPLCGIGFFLISVLFLWIGSRVNKGNIGEVNEAFLGKYHVIADLFLLFNSLVVFAGMLSATNSLLQLCYPLSPLYAYIFGILCAIIVHKGMGMILKCNAIVVPLTILVLLIVCFLNMPSTISTNSMHFYSVCSCLLYVSTNMMISSSFFVTINKLNKLTIVASSAIAATILTLLLFLLMLVLNENQLDEHAMPMLVLAKKLSRPLFYFTIIVIALSIFTTMLASMSNLYTYVLGFGGGKVWSLAVVLIAGLVVSNLGFQAVVSYLYPIIGILGLVYIAFILINLPKLRHPKKPSPLSKNLR